MKKTSTIILVLILLGLGAFFYFGSRGNPGAPESSIFASKDEKVIREKSLSFMEDLKYKDFQKAATYHSPEDQKNVDIPKLIERMFLVKPEQLDVMEYRILDADFDSSGQRARVKVKAKIHVLNTSEIRNPEIILYYHKKADQWYMELQSSLH